MKLCSYLLCSFLLIGCSTTKLAPLAGTKSEKVDKLLELTNQAGAFIKTVEQQIDQQRNSPIASQVPAGFFDAFLARVKEGGYSELLPMIKEAYMEIYTEEEINHLLRYQMDPMTQKMLEKQTQLTLKTTQIGSKWGEKVGAEVATKLMMSGNK